MGEVVAASSRLFSPCQRSLFLHGEGGAGFGRDERKCSHQLKKRNFHIKALSNSNHSTFSSRFNTDLPLYESPGASFDQYLEEKPRVFQAIFPDQEKLQLNEDEWRIRMPTLQFLFVTVCPVIDMRLRCKSKGKDYPPTVPSVITKVLELDTTRWELQGLDGVLDSSCFSVSIKGALYPDRRGRQSRIKNQLEINISFVIPPTLALVPEHAYRGVAESVFRVLVNDMKHKVNGGVLADYGKFKREKLKA